MPGLERRVLDAELEFAAPDRLRALQMAKLKPLLARTWQVNPFFRDHWQKARVDLDRIGDLSHFSAAVPMVDKAMFIEDQEVEPPYGRRHRHVMGLGMPLITMTSSGTSGQGVEIHLQTNEDLANHNRVHSFYFAWAGMRRADRAFLTMHVALLAGGRGEYHAALDYGLSVFPVAFYDTEQRLALARRFRPRALYGTTSYFGHLAAVAGDEVGTLGVEILLTGAEAASIAWFEKLQRQFKARAADRYGLTQMAVDHMFTCEHGIGTRERPGILHNVDPYVLLEVVDPETGRHVKDGEAGEIVVTSLYRTDVPMIRCRTRDRAVYRAAGACPCGRSWPGVEIGSVGRIDDMKKIKGINVWPQAVDELLFGDPEVEEYQVRLTTDERAGDLATLRVMPAASLSGPKRAALQETLAKALRQKIGIGFAVEVLAPGALDRSTYKARRWIDERAQLRS
jgi:phenylacetate-CoA ligase